MPALRVQWTKKIPLPSSMHSRKAYELAETYWMYRSLYLRSERQSKGEMAATLTTRVEDLVNMCQWPAGQYVLVASCPELAKAHRSVLPSDRFL